MKRIITIRSPKPRHAGAVFIAARERGTTEFLLKVYADGAAERRDVVEAIVDALRVKFTPFYDVDEEASR